MYKGPIIDTHMHLWDLANDYVWLSQDSPAMRQLFGNCDALRCNFLVPDYLELTRGWNITRSVHVQAMGFPGRPVAETEWLQQQANEHGFPHGIVALADLADPQLELVLRQHERQPNLRGVRMPLNHAPQPWRNLAEREDHMRDAAWRRGFALLARYGLVFDMQVYAHQVPDAVMLANDFADTTIVVEHLAWPIGDLQAGFGAWSVQMESLAACPNVVLKISGIGVVFRHADGGLIQRYLRQAVAIFGAQRCLFGSHCPPDTIFHPFDTLMGVYSEAFAQLPTDDQHQLFFGTAQRVYRL